MGLTNLSLKDLKVELEQDIKIILASDFEVDVTDTKLVPTIDTPDITYPNLDTKKLKAKKIQTCVLYMDIRKSTELNLQHKPITLTRLYAAFMRSMVKAAQYYNGKVRNIIGDRVMVVFDEENCFTNAVHTAVLLNSVAQYLLNKYFSHNDIKCGIGIDYGRMLVSKGGIRKNDKENAPYKSLVWLGRPANVASKLTDLANKTTTVTTTDTIKYIEKSESNAIGQNIRKDISIEEFFENDLLQNSGWVKFDKSNLPDAYYCMKPNMNYYYIKSKPQTISKTITTKPILMTQKVYEEYAKLNPEIKTVKEGAWKKQDSSLYPGYIIYEGDLFFSDIKD
jgi:adenylate cyclase